MESVRLGVIGVGGMGGVHARNILDEKIKGCRLTAVCDMSPEVLAGFPKVRGFSDSSEMIRSGEIDAILIATPHFSHTSIGVEALGRGLHALVEKPNSVHKADCQRLVAAHRNKKLVFAAMFNQRTNPGFIKVRNLIRNGDLGEVRRINWVITDWFRTDAYYASGGWRATWKGEGGGVLLNQCPHQLDLFQWMFGMPKRVRGFCRLGRYHKIEVEDDVTAYMEYANGATAVFITSTGEAPGTNRLEIAAERGRVVVEVNRNIQFTRNETPMSVFCHTARGGFDRPPVWEISIPAEGPGPQHAGIIQNFTDAILHGAPLISPAAEGIHSVELANAILFSSLEDRTVDMPLDAKAYERRLKQLMARSKPRKKVIRPAGGDFTKSFNI